MIGTGDVAGAAGAGPHAGCSFHHGADAFGVLAHAEIVVRAPDHDVLRPFRRMPDRMGKAASDPLEVGEHPIAPFAPQPAKRIDKKFAIFHDPSVSALEPPIIAA